jgi:hypothetical protein
MDQLKSPKRAKPERSLANPETRQWQTLAMAIAS